MVGRTRNLGRHRGVLIACLASVFLVTLSAVGTIAIAISSGPSAISAGALVTAALAVAAGVVAGWASMRTIRAERLSAQLTQEHQAQARVLSHEIRTPLAVIQGSAEVLVDAESALTGEQRGFLTAIITNTRVLLRMVEDLLTQARIDAGMFSMRPETVDYRHFIAGLVAEIRPLYPAEVHLGNLRAPLVVSLDPVLLRQALNNLVSNSVRYSTDARVLIRAIAQEDGVLTVISDFGPGIPRATGSAAAPHPDSNGIGLRVVRAIMELHGGALYLDSTPGHGTSASMYLPGARRRRST